MAGNLPSAADVRRAIEVYLRIAYGSTSLPRAVAAELEQLAKAGEGEFFALPVWERDWQRPPGRLSLRLGNRRYPHMKLVLERRADGLGYLLRVDTHDQHVLESMSGGACEAFREVVCSDAAVAKEIEAAWDRQGLATMKAYLVSQAAEQAHLTTAGR